MHKLFLALVVAMIWVAYLPGVSEARSVSPREHVQERFNERYERLEERRQEHERRVQEHYERHEKRLEDRCQRLRDRGAPRMPHFCGGSGDDHEEEPDSDQDQGDEHQDDGMEEPAPDDDGDEDTGGGDEGDMDDGEEAPAPTLDFWKHPDGEVAPGEKVALEWESNYTDECKASNGWSGTRPLAGKEYVMPSETTTYRITCTGDGGEIIRDQTIEVIDQGDEEPDDSEGDEGMEDGDMEEDTDDEGEDDESNDEDEGDDGTDDDDTGTTTEATLAMSVTPDTIEQGALAVLSWQATNVGTCVAFGEWDGEQALTGAVDVGPNETAIYTLVCTGDFGEVSESVTLTVTEPADDDDGSGGGGDDESEDDEGSDDDTGTTTEPITEGLVISEVLYDIDNETQGEESTNEWIEIYNGSSNAINLDGWRIEDGAGSSDTLGAVEIPAGGYLILTASGTTANFWTFPLGTTVVSIDSSLGNGLSNAGDSVLLYDTSDTLVDAVSWASSEVAFSPSVADVTAGHSIERCAITDDTDTAADWRDQDEPNPGSNDCDAPEDGDEGNEDEGEEPDDDTGTTTPPTEEEDEDTGTTTPSTEVVLINEVYYDVDDTHGTEAANEWVELYNPSDTPIDLIGWNINDGGAGSTFGESVVIGAGEFLVLAESTTTADFWTIGSPVALIPLPSLSNTGDALYLNDGAASQVDAMSWGNNTDVFDPSAPDVSEGHSLERCELGDDTDTALDWVDLETPTPGSSGCDSVDPPDEPDEGDIGDGDTGTTTPPATGTVVISEVYYDVDDTHGSESANEWVELFNAGDTPVDIGGWSLSDAASSDELPADLLMQPGEYLVVTNSTTTLNFWTFPGITVVALQSSIGNSLGNTGDALYLSDTEARVVDSVSWGGNIDVFDPSVIDVVEGHSIARDPVATDTDTAADWIDLETPTPGV